MFVSGIGATPHLDRQIGQRMPTRDNAAIGHAIDRYRAQLKDFAMTQRKPIRFILLISAALTVAACQVTGLGPVDHPRSYGTVSEP